VGDRALPCIKLGISQTIGYTPRPQQRGKAMPVSTEEVKKIAHLARINVTEEELTQYQSELTNILGLVEKLDAVKNLENVEPMSHPFEITQPLREDTVTETNQRDEFQKLAPNTEHGLYLVNQAIED
jgi:aspartyl-tRNA(Asn)/glutamyl-tRNA(Gln) amidotransferase subunit C